MTEERAMQKSRIFWWIIRREKESKDIIVEQQPVRGYNSHFFQGAGVGGVGATTDQGVAIITGRKKQALEQDWRFRRKSQNRWNNHMRYESIFSTCFARTLKINCYKVPLQSLTFLSEVCSLLLHYETILRDNSTYVRHDFELNKNIWYLYPQCHFLSRWRTVVVRDYSELWLTGMQPLRRSWVRGKCADRNGRCREERIF